MPSLPSPPTLWPTYLIPSLPFRRRTSTTTSSPSPSTSPPTPSSYLPGHGSHLKCARCLSDLALSTQIISKGFTGRHGRAYLVAPTPSSISANPLHLATPKAKNDALPNLPNTFTYKPVPRQLVTGAHTVSDIHCAQCGAGLGWKYVAAEEEAQRYKVGKFILETKRVVRGVAWEVGDEGVEEGRRRGSLVPLSEGELRGGGGGDEEVEFDSQDEEECEDLFLGVWTPQLAGRRRRARGFGRGGED
ncbi:yippee-domain-containing protein [Teratosphaeria nubilosa]|uniref:Yippee-domain-containing protein n=1 Tax=Teratosphaeria nubilosa TaxID=161662 RepID=A0A6G1LHT9_9PEZI|nr:yippee-domain-containing protein [Teratosphaeria nubilosa]